MKVYMIDSNKCTGCHLCELACSYKHYKTFSPELSNIKIESIEDIAFNVPNNCMQCEQANCIKVCVAGALYRDNKTGSILIDKNRCIGCKACAMACPFGAISLVKKNSKLEISICDLCAGDPECIKVCRSGAINYLEDSKINKIKRKVVLNRLLDESNENSHKR
ncbi:MAG TPA: 4Fe-4S dicluster domain-containing protein [Clostridia bacterium]|nr:4Fe-4S dicluster domain-containing protein [Clostridia bacterium]